MLTSQLIVQRVNNDQVLSWYPIQGLVRSSRFKPFIQVNFSSKCKVWNLKHSQYCTGLWDLDWFNWNLCLHLSVSHLASFYCWWREEGPFITWTASPHKFYPGNQLHWFLLWQAEEQVNCFRNEESEKEIELGLRTWLPADFSLILTLSVVSLKLLSQTFWSNSKKYWRQKFSILFIL